jgi:hypothetical protein
MLRPRLEYFLWKGVGFMPTFNIHPEIRPEFDVRLGTDTAHVGEGSVAGRISPVSLKSQDFGLSNAPVTAPHSSFTGPHGSRVFTFPNDPNVYRPMEVQSRPGFLQLGVFDPEAKVVVQRPKLMMRDGHGDWTLTDSMLGGGKVNSKHEPESTPLFSSSANAAGYGSSTSHSYSSRSGWGNASTASPGASASASSGRSPSGWSNPSTGSPGVSTSAGSGAPHAPPRNTRAGAGSQNSSLSQAGRAPKLGPVPDQRYLTDSGDGKSKYWIISDGRMGYKPADSSLDRYGYSQHVFVAGPYMGMGVWTGPNSSVSSPPSSTRP